MRRRLLCQCGTWLALSSARAHLSTAAAAASTGIPALAGSVAVVTGGSGAIGKAISQALVNSGATVVITGRRGDALESAAERIMSVGDATGAAGSVHCAVADVTCEDQVIGLFQRVIAEHGKCDILVNNAGIATGGDPVDISGDAFSSVMDVNVLGPFLCSREAFRHMRQRGAGGRILNVASISSQSPRPHSAPYTASKYALQGLSRSFALDGRPHGIAVSTIHPGNVASDLLSPEEIARRQESEGLMAPEDVAASVLHMCSMPPGTNVLDMTVVPTRQPLIGRG